MSLDIKSVYRKLRRQHGEQDWWPGDSAFEIMIGAILTQNTAWSNVERALANLKSANALTIQGVLGMPLDQLAQAVRPSGYYNQKASRVKGFCEWLDQRGGVDALRERETGSLRSELLSLHGIGPETADDILLYALDRPVFVIDAYTRRIFSRLDLISGLEKYDDLRAQFEANLESSTQVFNEFHALIVIHAKDVCRKNPLCGKCDLSGHCSFSR